MKTIEDTLEERNSFVSRCDGIEEQLKQRQVEEWKYVYVDEVPSELQRNNVSQSVEIFELKIMYF